MAFCVGVCTPSFAACQLIRHPGLPRAARSGLAPTQTICCQIGLSSSQVLCNAFGERAAENRAPAASQHSRQSLRQTTCKALPWVAPPVEATALLTVASIMGLLASLPGLLMIHGGLARVGSISIRSVLGGLDKALLNGLGPESLLQGVKIPELLLVLHSMQGAIAAACIMLGGLVERVKLMPRLAIVALWTLVVYAPVTHAVAAGPGSLLGDLWVFDAAGSLAQHLAPAASALTAIQVFGGAPAGEGTHNAPLAAIGFAFLLLGWIFHCVGAVAAAGTPVTTVALNIQLSLSLSALVWSSFDGAARCPNLMGTCFGAISGLVAIMPACGHVNCFGALTTGFLAGFFAWLLKGQSDEAVMFPRVIAISSIIGCLSAGALSHTLFGGVQSSVVFTTQAVVQAFCTVLVAAWASLGTMGCIAIVLALFRKVSLPEDSPGGDVELVA